MTMNLHDGGFPSGLSPQRTVLESHKLCFFPQSLSRLCPVCLFQRRFLFQVSPQRLCKLLKHYHSRLHEFFIPERSSLPPQPFQAGSSPNQGFPSSVRNSGKTTGIIRKHSSLIQKSVAPPPTPNAFHYLSIIRLELFTSLPLIIHFTAFVISMEGGTKAGLFSLQSPSHF